jgi:hypothetical protein
MVSEPLDVAAIRAALVKATPSNWQVIDEHSLGAEIYSLGDDKGHWLGIDLDAADAELIVLLRNNAGALLDIAEHVGVLDRLADRVVAQRDGALEALAADRAKVAEQSARMASVLELHYRVLDDCGGCRGEWSWPCPTVRAIRGEQ